MSELKTIYSANLKNARAEANKKVRDTQKAYDTLANKESDYAYVVKSMLFLYKESAEVYNKAPSKIVFEHEPF